MSRTLHKGALIGAGLAIFLGLLGWKYIWRSPAYYPDNGVIVLPVPVMTREEYDRVVNTHPRPHIVDITTPEGATLLYGSTHTRDPHDPQLADIKKYWDAFRPSVALIEGLGGFLIPGYMDPVEQFGESGAVYQWARRDGIPTYTWEPDRSAEVRLLVQQFPKEQVALFYSLRPYFGDVRFGKPADPDKRIESYIGDRTDYPEISGVLHSATDIDLIWKRDFPHLPDWRDTDDRFGFPPGYLTTISDQVGQLRDEHLARSVIDLVHKGQRVFVVAGSGHTVKLDATLRAALTPPSTTND